tara:strand:- start:26372 stop:26572 length:201 start_codon:yes stop_codon:yes gene_type:complete
MTRKTPAATTESALPAPLYLEKGMRYRGKSYPHGEVIYPADLGMDAETVRWLIASGTAVDPDGEEK